MGSVLPILHLSMSTEAALFTADDAHRRKCIAVPERAIRHLVSQPSPWRLCDGVVLSMPSAVTDRELC